MNNSYSTDIPYQPYQHQVHETCTISSTFSTTFNDLQRCLARNEPGACTRLDRLVTGRFSRNRQAFHPCRLCPICYFSDRLRIQATCCIHSAETNPPGNSFTSSFTHLSRKTSSRTCLSNTIAVCHPLIQAHVSLGARSSSTRQFLSRLSVYCNHLGFALIHSQIQPYHT